MRSKIVEERHRHLVHWLPYLLITLMAVSIVWYQAERGFFINGIDSFFHMSIAYDTYQQLRTAHFSYFLSAYGFDRCLRIVNAVYGPLGGYFSGFLLLICGNWVRWEIVTMLIVFVIAGVSMDQLCRYWKVKPLVSVLAGFLYMFSAPLMWMWLNSQYDGVGAAFIPWILEFGSRILNRDRFPIWRLVILLVVLAEIHLFSMLLGLLVFAICSGVALFYRHDRGRLVKKLLRILFLTLLLSFNVIGGIWEVLGSNRPDLLPTYSFRDVFQDVWGCVSYDDKMSLSNNLVLLGASATVLLIVILFAYVFSCRGFNFRLNFLVLFFGIGFLWLASRWFPWDVLQKIWPVLDTDLQFPKRFLPVSIAALDLGLGIVISNVSYRPGFYKIIYVAAVLILGLFIIHAWQNTRTQSVLLANQYRSARYYSGTGFYNMTRDFWLNKRAPRRLRASLRSRQPGRYFRVVTKLTPDYLPTNRPITDDAQYHRFGGYRKYNAQVVQNRLPLHFAVNHHVVTVSFTAGSRKPVQLPIVKYRHTLIDLNHRPLKHFQLAGVGAVKLRPRPGLNVMTFRYQPSNWYRMLMVISVLAWGLLILAVLIRTL